MAKVARLLISGNIGEQDPFMLAMGDKPWVNSDTVRTFIEANKTATEFEVEIDSNGGSVTHGFAIHDLLVKSGKKITTIGINIKSIATVIFMAGSTRKITANAEFLIHNPTLNPEQLGNMGLEAADFQAIANEMQFEENKILNFYSDSLKLAEQKKNELKTLMGKNSPMSVEDAVTWGFATEVINEVKASSHFPVYAFSDKILNIINNKSKYMDKVEASKEFGLIKTMFATIKTALKIKDKQNASSDLEDGTKLFYDGELAVGVAVFTDEALTAAAADGDYILADGSTVAVLAGLVTVVVAAVVENLADLKIKALTLQKEVDARKAEIETMKAEIADNKIKISEFATAFENFEKTHFTVEPTKTSIVAKVQAIAKDVVIVEVDRYTNLRKELSRN